MDSRSKNNFNTTIGRKSIYFVISVLVIICGYAAIIGYHVTRQKHVTLMSKIHQEYDFNNHYMTIESWKYSKSQEVMEIIISVDNKSHDGKDYYDGYAITRKGQTFDVQCVLNTRNYLVYIIDGVPEKFGELSFRVSYDDETKENPLKLYTNHEAIENVDTIYAKSQQEYYIERNDRLIASYQNEIKEYEQKISEYSLMIQNANVNIEDIRNQEKYRTEQEKKEDLQDIASIQMDITKCEEDINSLNEKINENQKRIENCEKENEDLKSVSE